MSPPADQKELKPAAGEDLSCRKPRISGKMDVFVAQVEEGRVGQRLFVLLSPVVNF
jgi:hypothetical protein